MDIICKYYSQRSHHASRQVYSDGSYSNCSYDALALATPDSRFSFVKIKSLNILELHKYTVAGYYVCKYDNVCVYIPDFNLRGLNNRFMVCL